MKLKKKFTKIKMRLYIGPKIIEEYRFTITTNSCLKFYTLYSKGSVSSIFVSRHNTYF